MEKRRLNRSKVGCSAPSELGGGRGRHRRLARSRRYGAPVGRGRAALAHQGVVVQQLGSRRVHGRLPNCGLVDTEPCTVAWTSALYTSTPHVSDDSRLQQEGADHSVGLTSDLAAELLHGGRSHTGRCGGRGFAVPQAGGRCPPDVHAWRPLVLHGVFMAVSLLPDSGRRRQHSRTRSSIPVRPTLLAATDEPTTAPNARAKGHSGHGKPHSKRVRDVRRQT